MTKQEAAVLAWIGALPRHVLALAAAFIIAPAVGDPARAAERCTATALVFAIDASSSIDDSVYATQVSGIADALGSSDVLAAIRSGGGLSVAAVVWADDAMGVRVIPWDRIFGASDAARFAGRLTALPRDLGGGTDIGVGLARALDLFQDPALCAARHVVDISGNGRESRRPRRAASVTLSAARGRAERLGVTVNGLAIAGNEPGLDAYYRSFVASGPGSFVIEAVGTGDFGRAMRIKLLREIGAADIAWSGRQTFQPSLYRRGHGDAPPEDPGHSLGNFRQDDAVAEAAAKMAGKADNDIFTRLAAGIEPRAGIIAPQ